MSFEFSSGFLHSDIILPILSLTLLHFLVSVCVFEILLHYNTLFEVSYFIQHMDIKYKLMIERLIKRNLQSRLTLFLRLCYHVMARTSWGLAIPDNVNYTLLGITLTW